MINVTYVNRSASEATQTFEEEDGCTLQDALDSAGAASDILTTHTVRVVHLNGTSDLGKSDVVLQDGDIISANPKKMVGQ